MRMLKTRKKWISLLVTLTFLLTLFPMALPAFAANYSRLGSVAEVEDNDVFRLNTVKAVFSPGELREGNEVTIRLPTNFEFRKEDDKATAMTNDDWIGSKSSDELYIYGNKAGNHIATLIGDDEGFNGGSDSEEDLIVTMVANNEIKIKVNKAPKLNEDATMFIYLEDIYVDDGYDGDIELTFNAPGGSGFDSGDVVVGRVSGSKVTVEVIDSDNFSDNGNVTIRIKENRAKGFDKKDPVVKLVLPDGFVWGMPADADKNIIFGDLTEDNFTFKLDDRDELKINLNGERSNEATTFEFIAPISVDDETRAKLGDVVAKVKGESNSTPSEIVVGRYGEHDVTAEAKGDPTTVYAGKAGQELQNLLIKESVTDSLVVNRTITLTLPEWAKWADLKDNLDHKGCELELESFPGRDGKVAKYTVQKPSKNDPAELNIKDLEVFLSPDAPEGDLVVEIGGTAGVRGEVKLAEVKKPVDVKVSETPTLVIGRAGQAIGEITITEAEEGLLEKSEDLVLELPKDIEWDEYEVEVTEGDLRIDRVKENYQYLNIKIDKESNDPSTIKITGTVTAYRTVPEGRVEVEVGGRALIEVNDTKEVFKDKKEDLEIGKVTAIEYKKYDKGLWEKEDYVVKTAVATVGTPAPGDLKATAVFTVGSTEYTIDGVAKTMDAAPYIKDSRTFLPVRYVGEAVGVAEDKVLWDDAAKTATFIKGDRIAQVTIGSKEMLVNGAKVTMDVAPEINNGRTMMPIRWIGIAFDAELDWDNEAKTVTIN